MNTNFKAQTAALLKSLNDEWKSEHEIPGLSGTPNYIPPAHAAAWTSFMQEINPD